ncbi:hypothetical protein H0H93_007038 [Arthromyces matolae]|nr:hypothetical protein H0H93_007038 [Arthromyces matolae]
MSILDRRYPTDSGHIFTSMVAFQRDSLNLVCFAVVLCRLVTMAWPMSNGILILPTGVRGFLRTRGVHWACFCALILGEGQTCSSRIVHADSGDVLVFCGRRNAGHDCGFFMNLTKIYKKLTLRAHYDNYPTLGKFHQSHLKLFLIVSLASGRAPDMEVLVRAHRLESYPDDEIGEYFEGYLGEHVTSFPGVEQLAGESVRPQRRISAPYLNVITPEEARMILTPEEARVRRERLYPTFPHRKLSARTMINALTPPGPEVAARRRAAKDLDVIPFVASANNSASAIRVRRKPKPVPAPFPMSLSAPPAPSSSLSAPSASTRPSAPSSQSKGKGKAPDPFAKEGKLLQRLQSGGGVDPEEFVALFDNCSVCDKVFLAIYNLIVYIGNYNNILDIKKTNQVKTNNHEL